MVKRLCVSLLVLTLLVVSATPALAQDTGFCADLAAEDCELLYESSDVMSRVVSGNTISEVSIVAQNLPEVPYPNVAFDLVHEVSFNTSDEATAVVMDMMEMDPAALAEMMQDSEAMTEMFSMVFVGLSTEMRSDIAFSSDLAQLIEEQAQVPWPETVNLNLVLIEGVLYVDMDALAETVPEAAMLGGGWIGLELAPLIEEAMMQEQAAVAVPGPTGQMMTVDPAVMAASMTGDSAGPLFSQLGALDPQGVILQYLNIARLPEGEIDVSGLESANNEEVAVFATTVNFQEFLASDLFAQLLTQALASQQGSMPSEAEVSQIMGLVQLVGPLVLNSLTLELLEAIGTDSAFLYGYDFILSLDLTQLLSMAAMAGDALPELNLQTEGPSGFEVTVLQTASDLNTEIEITAPEGATVFTAEQLTLLLEQMSQ